MSPLSLPEELRAMTLLDFFSNPLFLYHSIPYLPVSSVLSLATTSKAFRNLIFETPSVFRYLDLSRVKAAKFNIAAIDNGGQTWRNVQLDENVTEDEYALSLDEISLQRLVELSLIELTVSTVAHYEASSQACLAAMFSKMSRR